MTRSLATLPNNTTTSQTAEVYSTTGFTAGDLVYYQGGDYKGAGSLTNSNSVVFDNTVNVNTSNDFGNAAISPVFSTTSATAVGSTGGKFAAVLTNGNIVQSFVNTGPTAGTGTTAQSIYFRIVNTSGVVQVAATRVATNTVQYSFTANVVALTGGGFAVVFRNASGIVSYAIYTNTGTVTTALTTDTGITANSANRLEAVALANGGFAVATINDATSFMVTRAYNATGVAAYAWTSTGIAPTNATSPFGLSARSDSSTIVAFVTTSTRVSYYLYDSAGTLITSNFTGITVAAYPTVSVICLVDGTTYVIGYIQQTTNFQPSFNLLPTGNALGSRISIPIANFNSSTTANPVYSQISLLAQASGGFTLVFADFFNTINYAFYNASGTILSGASPTYIPTARACPNFAITLLEISGFVNMYWTVGERLQSQSNPNQSFVQINSTTYALVSQTSTASTILSSATLPAGTAVVAAATPANTKFYPATTTSNSSTKALGAVVLATTSVSTSACQSISSCTLPNGQFVIAYKLLASPYTVFASVYSVTGTLVTTITVGAGASSLGGVKVAALSSGKFVVGWLYGGSAFYLTLYSSTFTQIGSSQSITLNTTYGPTTTNFDIAGLGGNTDRYVVAFIIPSSSFAAFSVYDNTNTVVYQNTSASGGNATQNIRVSADHFGGFGISFPISLVMRMNIYTQYDTSLYAATSTNFTSSYSSLVSNTQQSSLLYSNNGYYHAVNASGQVIGYHFPTNATTTTSLALGSLVNNLVTTTAACTQALGLNGNGHVIFVSQNSASLVNIYVLLGGVSYNTTGGSSVATVPPNNTTITATNNATSYGQYSICPSLGNNFVLAWLDSNNFPTFAIYNALALTTTFTSTVGVTQSNATPISPVPSTSSVPNTVLAGVAVTGATAGSTGQVAVNGLAQLNSNYPSGTVQSFDFTGQAVGGVKGVINGRTVNMQGNS